MTLFTASRKSFSVTVFLLALIAYIPASVHTLLISAPVNKTQVRTNLKRQKESMKAVLWFRDHYQLSLGRDEQGAQNGCLFHSSWFVCESWRSGFYSPDQEDQTQPYGQDVQDVEEQGPMCQAWFRELIQKKKHQWVKRYYWWCAV